jgi:hypothetical protein
MTFQKGVLQGGILFNIYIEEALKQSPLLTNKINQRDLLAYADDLLVQASSEQELQLILDHLNQVLLDHQI